MPFTDKAVALAADVLKLVESAHSSENVGDAPGEVWNARVRVQDMCAGLLREILGPLEYTSLIASSCHESQALYFVTQLNISDLIGDKEVGLEELCEQAGVDPQYLSTVMNCVIGLGYFEEVGHFGSRTYRNNELSRVLAASSSLTMHSAVGFVGDESFRASSRLLDAAKFNRHHLNGPRKSGFSIAYDFDDSCFQWMSKPGQAWRGERLGLAMRQLHRMANDHIGTDYPWSKLASPIVDIGGGIGTLERKLLSDDQNSHLQFQLFDIPKTIENAKEVWKSHPMCSAISFVPGDFMASKPQDNNIPQGQPTYILNHVLHDWTDSEVVTILANVRTAMSNESRLLVSETLIWPDSSRFVRVTGVQLLALNNGITRTKDHIVSLIGLAGLKVVSVTRMRATTAIIETIPK